ncbi:hypothetical protein H4R21_004242, partial [Coemansia helicoidea]
MQAWRQARPRCTAAAGAAALRRTLATGTVYVRRLPAWAEAVTLERAAAPHAHVFGVWIGQDGKRQVGDPPARLAAVRITTDAVPADLEDIARLPDPTPDEIQRCKAALLAVVGELGRLGIHAMPVAKGPDMFQVGARRALGQGAASRRFDVATSSTPRYSCGLIEGYRYGFAEARRKRSVAQLLAQCESSDDELRFMLDYF